MREWEEGWSVGVGGCEGVGEEMLYGGGCAGEEMVCGVREKEERGCVG